MLLLAENETGYKNLLQIASAAQLEGFYYYPRIDHEFLAAHAEGLIATSGCMSAEVPRAILDEGIGRRHARSWTGITKFSATRISSSSCSSTTSPSWKRSTSTLIDLGKHYNARFIATNDVHYINQEDARYQDILLAIQTGSLLSDPNRMRMNDNSYYLRIAAGDGRAVRRSARSDQQHPAGRRALQRGPGPHRLPPAALPGARGQHRRNLPARAVRGRPAAGATADRSSDPNVRQRLEYELGVIHTDGVRHLFPDRVGPVPHGARSRASGTTPAVRQPARWWPIPWTSPWSSRSSHGLIFERFLNPGRISMPDIDLDFQDDRRSEVMEYCANKYGDDKVAQIITFGTLGARAAIRDVGRVMDIPTLRGRPRHQADPATCPATRSPSAKRWRQCPSSRKFTTTPSTCAS